MRMIMIIKLKRKKKDSSVLNVWLKLILEKPQTIKNRKMKKLTVEPNTKERKINFDAT